MFQNMCTYARLITHCPQRDTSCYFSLVEVVRETKKTIAFLWCLWLEVDLADVSSPFSLAPLVAVLVVVHDVHAAVVTATIGLSFRPQVRGHPSAVCPAEPHVAVFVLSTNPYTPPIQSSLETEKTHFIPNRKTKRIASLNNSLPIMSFPIQTDSMRLISHLLRNLFTHLWQLEAAVITLAAAVELRLF